MIDNIKLTIYQNIKLNTGIMKYRDIVELDKTVKLNNAINLHDELDDVEIKTFDIISTKHFDDNIDSVIHSRQVKASSHLKYNNRKYSHNKEYIPKITLSRVYGNIFISIMPSLPKLFFGNNLEELNQFDFALVVQKLSQTLLEYGIDIKPEVLALAGASQVHYSKVFVMKDYQRANDVIKAMQSSSVHKTSTLRVKEFQTDARMVGFYNTRQHITFYNKTLELAEDLKEKINACNKELINLAKKNKQDLKQVKAKEHGKSNKADKDATDSKDINGTDIEDVKHTRDDIVRFLEEYGGNDVLKMEIKLLDRDKIRQTIKAHTGTELENADIIFANVYNDFISKSILSHWFEGIKKSITHFALSQSSDNLFIKLYHHSKRTDLKINEKNFLILDGYFRLLKDMSEVEIKKTHPKCYKSVETILKKYYNNSKNIVQILNQDEQEYIKDIIDDMDDVLYNFKSLRIRGEDRVFESSYSYEEDEDFQVPDDIDFTSNGIYKVTRELDNQEKKMERSNDTPLSIMYARGEDAVQRFRREMEIGTKKNNAIKKHLQPVKDFEDELKKFDDIVKSSYDECKDSIRSINDIVRKIQKYRNSFIISSAQELIKHNIKEPIEKDSFIVNQESYRSYIKRTGSDEISNAFDEFLQSSTYKNITDLTNAKKIQAINQKRSKAINEFYDKVALEIVNDRKVRDVKDIDMARSVVRDDDKMQKYIPGYNDDYHDSYHNNYYYNSLGEKIENVNLYNDYSNKLSSGIYEIDNQFNSEIRKFVASNKFHNSYSYKKLAQRRQSILEKKGNSVLSRLLRDSIEKNDKILQKILKQSVGGSFSGSNGAFDDYERIGSTEDDLVEV